MLKDSNHLAIIRKRNRGDHTPYPFERLDSLSVTILESMTEFSPSLSSKKKPKSRAVILAASCETKTDRASESSSLGSSMSWSIGAYVGDGRLRRNGQFTADVTA
jgi:hypothetical protein